MRIDKLVNVTAWLKYVYCRGGGGEQFDNEGWIVGWLINLLFLLQNQMACIFQLDVVAAH